MPDAATTDLKTALRTRARAQRAALRSSDRIAHAEAAAAHFLDGLDFPEDMVIAAYWPIRDEIDCKPVLIALMDALRTVCLPVVISDEVPLQFRVWEQGAQLYEAGFGTLAPGDNAPLATPDVIIVPLLGFDKHGTRLGYGRGYYDRTIAALPKRPILVGYAFAAQELDEIPRDDHDAPLDYLVTEDGVRRFAI